MSDLARQAAKLIVDSREDWDSENEALCDVQDHINSVGTLVSHADAETLKQITCRDPLTLEKAVEVMGREPDVSHSSSYRTRHDWGDNASFRSYIDSNNMLVFGNDDYLNPTVGQFACLVLAAKMGEQA